MSKPKRNTTLADMSLPAGERAKGRKPGIIRVTPAQMDHANGPRARRLRRDGERWLEAEARLHEDAAGFADEIAGLDEEGFVSRVLEGLDD